MAQDTNKVSFKDTLNLPTTDFPIRANPKIDDPAMIARWEQEKLFRTSFDHNKGKEKFILHDGPPYANGHIHIGHAYNKTLKDIVGKSQRMLGQQVPITPGWDCHGLPIELKVSQENPGLDAAALKKKCREYANHWIKTQKEEFKRLGVLMDWDRPYTTMSYEYESAILRAFGSFVTQGYIERKNKTVPWCASCQTVLATAEIEYQDRKDPSLYVTFPLEQSTVDAAFPTLKGKGVSLAVWTTTPWTLPLNRAVLIKPGGDYVVVEVGEKLVAIGKSLADALCALLQVDKKVVAEFKAEALLTVGARAQHPFIDGLVVPVLASEHVSLDDGTAFVHCAPGCGPEDYETGVRNNLEIFSPLSTDGRYTQGIMPQELEGMLVSDGQIWAIKKLAEKGTLLYKTSIKHSYPHCWRCRNGLIFRATKQWFCDLSRNNLKQKAITEIDASIMTLPDKSNNRLSSTIEGRLEWCLSRQRVWGVPIPALLCTACDATYITPELIETVAKKVAQEGIEYWDTASITELVGSNFACHVCKKSSFIKEKDILDVWFDSGVSHYAVLYNNPELAFPANMYLEGKDQHRGWFQSSLLTALVLEDKAPMKTILTHGYTVDGNGRKMSKSLGNVVSPQEMIDQLGTDGLRLWVSSIDYAADATISLVLNENVKEVFRKIRNTCRFLLANLYDYDHTKDAVAIDELLAVDRYALLELCEFNEKIIAAYQAYDFTAVFHHLGDYSAANLSSFYLDIIKDRLYVEKANGPLRRSAQTTSWYILDALTRLMAPILSFTAEQVSDAYQKDKKQSIHLQEFVQLQTLRDELVSSSMGKDVVLKAQSYHTTWDALKAIRSAVLKEIEVLREQGIIKHSLEAQLTLHFAKDMKDGDMLHAFFAQLDKNAQKQQAFLEEFFIVSQVTIADSATGLGQSEYPGLFVKVAQAAGDKCPRCWQFDITTHEHKLCTRCQAIVK